MLQHLTSLMVNFFLLLSKLYLAADCALIFFAMPHIHLLLYHRAAPHSQSQPQDCPKERILHLFLLNFRRLLPGCGLMGPQPAFFRAELR